MSGFMDDLCKLDPERFKFDTNHYLVRLSEATHRVYTNITPGPAVIQAAVQEAVEARGWAFSLLFSGKRYSAEIHKPHETKAPTTMDSWLTPVMALSDAYIEALKLNP